MSRACRRRHWEGRGRSSRRRRGHDELLRVTLRGKRLREHVRVTYTLWQRAREVQLRGRDRLPPALVSVGRHRARRTRRHKGRSRVV